MFSSTHKVSLVTAVLPKNSAQDVLIALTEDEHANALVSQARGSVLREHWWKAWVPPISPAKAMLRLLVPDQDLDRVVSMVVEHGRLHLQASGAVFSHSSESVYIGSSCHLIEPDKVAPSHADDHKLKSNLHAIFCVVNHAASDRVAKAAINAGAHGPVVYYSEGHGLRDRLGWLRITKEAEQEVLMVITDDVDVDVIFDAMAKAGELHLPGRGFMYRLEINKGMFNLPSRLSNHHFDANMQQIIHAIDHLAGHSHWRDQSVFNIGGEGKGVGLESLPHRESAMRNQSCFTIVIDRDHSQLLMDLLLDTGAPGLNLSYAKLLTDHDEEHHLAHASVNQEYAVMRCIFDKPTALNVSNAIGSQAEGLGLSDLCVLTHDVPQVATYVPGRADHRAVKKAVPEKTNKSQAELAVSTSSK